VLVFQDGRIVEQGATEAVLGRPQHAYTQTLLASVPDIQRGLSEGFTAA
jgi:peptide/nickel transport system ATP-binding protein